MPARRQTPAASRASGTRILAVLMATAAALVGLAIPARSEAQAVQPHEALEDAKLYFTAPLRWDGGDWLFFGGTLAAIGIAHHYDAQVREHFVDSSPSALDGKDPHSTNDALPAAVLVAGTWLLAGVMDQPAGWRELGSMLEATTFTAVSGELFKYAFGRQRPNETTDPNQWFHGGASFPSLHAGAAFAIGTVFAESGNDSDRWLRRLLGYGVAGYTAYARVQHNAHWTSDVVAGASLGFSTARFTMHRREDGSEQRASAMLVPVEGDGVMLAFVIPLH